MGHKMKCIVHGCSNHSEEGEFVGDMCKPCHDMITTGRADKPSDNFIHKLYMKRAILRAEVIERLGDVVRLVIDRHGDKE